MDWCLTWCKSVALEDRCLALSPCKQRKSHHSYVISTKPKFSHRTCQLYKNGIFWSLIPTENPFPPLLSTYSPWSNINWHMQSLTSSTSAFLIPPHTIPVGSEYTFGSVDSTKIHSFTISPHPALATSPPHCRTTSFKLPMHLLVQVSSPRRRKLWAEINQKLICSLAFSRLSTCLISPLSDAVSFSLLPELLNFHPLDSFTSLLYGLPEPWLSKLPLIQNPCPCQSLGTALLLFLDCPLASLLFQILA